MSTPEHLRVPIDATTGAPLESLAARAPQTRTDRFTLDALSGRLVELTAPAGSAVLTAATSLVLEAQHRREPAAWVSVGDSVVYPVDLAASGVDLAALPIIRTRSAITAARAADELLRSGGFALVVIDLADERLGRGGRSSARREPHRRGPRGARTPHAHESYAGTSLANVPAIPLPVQTRLAGLANRHRAALVCLTRKSDGVPSLGSLVTLRARSDVMRTGFDRFAWTLDVVKDKRNGPGWRHEGICRGPDGLV